MNSHSRAIVQCLLIAILLPQSLQSQTYKPVNISLSQGLSQSCVYSIVQDRQGFIWMATQDGLNRYDGIQFKTFRDEPFDTTTLSTSFIRCLFTDSRGWLWAGTQHQGLNLFVPSSQTFRHFKTETYPLLGNNNITRITEDRTGTLWISTSAGISSLTISGKDPAKAEVNFQKIILRKNQTADMVVFNLMVDRKNNLWAATMDSIFQFSITAPGATLMNAWNVKSTGLGCGEITSFSTDRRDRIWIGCSNGISIFDYNKQTFENITAKDEALNQLVCNDYVSSVIISSADELWIGTGSSGLYKLKNASEKTGFSVAGMEKISLDKSRSSNMVLCILEDQINPGLMWIGTFAGGTYKLIPLLKNFSSDFLQYPGVESPLVTSALKDNSGIIWLGTQNGLIRNNRSKKEVHVFKYTKKREWLMANYISAIRQDEEGNIWVGTEIGVQRILNPYSASPTFKTYYIEENQMGKFVRGLYLDNDKNLYVHFRKEIFRYDRPSDSFILFCSEPDSSNRSQRGYAITSMLIDRSKNLWIGSTMGLTVFPSQNNAVSILHPQHYYHRLTDTLSLRSHSIQSITEDSRGVIWIGTANGLTRAVIENKNVRFRNYSSAHKIKNNQVYAAVEDPETGFIWLSTNGGLTRFDPEGISTANFDINDGLQSNEFNGGAYARAADGEMLFGGIQGYTSFYPSQIVIDTIPPRVWLTDFMMPGNPKEIIRDKSGLQSVTLKCFENSFTIHFIGLHYNDPVKNQYAYKLEGFQPDWTHCGNARQVNFSQLPPGQYIFKVIASNNDGVFSTQNDALTIIIKPPFYQTIWFYLLLLVFIAAILWLLHIYRLQLKMAQVKEVERIRKETAADFHDELGHKLTTISWFSEILKKKLNEEQSEQKSYLDKIIETSGNLYLTMKDLLWAMDPEKDSVYETYQQLKNFGQELFDHTGIEFNAHNIPVELKEIDLPLAYKRHILLIFKEIMHNSLKHAHPNHTFLDLENNNGNLILRFGDDGPGFSPQMENGHGNGIKNVMRRAEIIQAQAGFRMNGKGTLFEINISLN